MGFDFKKILSKFQKKKRKTNVDEFQQEDNFLENDDLLEDGEPENLENNEDLEEETLQEDKKTEKGESKRKIRIDFKNKKVKILIIGAGVLTATAVAVPFVMSYIGEQQANEIASMNNKPFNNTFHPPVNYRRPKSRRRIPVRHFNQREKPKIAITRKTKEYNILHVEGKAKPKTKKISAKSLYAQNNGANKQRAVNKIAFIQKEIQNTTRNIERIQSHLVHARLTGVEDPIGMVDKTIMQNRNFDLYLQSQIQLMRKLVTFYKQKAELQKTLRLYQMAFGENNKGNGSGINRNAQQSRTEKEAQIIKETLSQIVAPLQQQISNLKKEIIKQRQNGGQKQRANLSSFKSFREMTKTDLDNLNIFIKNGKYIAVIHTDLGDKIFREGDYFNGFKIEKILPNMIIFEKNGQEYYYTYNQTLNQNYQVAQIKLPKKISETNVKSNSKKGYKVKEYKPISRQQLLQRLLQKRLQQMNNS